MRSYLDSLDFLSIGAGFIAYIVAVLVSSALVFLTFRLNGLVGRRVDQEARLQEGHRSLAIALGATLLSQAILLRHVVVPVMAVIRDLFVQRGQTSSVGLIFFQGLSIFTLICLLCIASVWLGSFLFIKMTGKLNEYKEIDNDNLAVAIFYAFAIISIALIMNEGVQDLSRSLIPYGFSGVVRIP